MDSEIKLRSIKEDNKVRKIAAGIFKYLLVVFVVAISLYPILWVIMTSLKSNIEIHASSLSLPLHPTLNAYILAFKYVPFPKYYFNSISITVINTLLNVILVSMAAYVVARYDFKFKNLIIVLFTATLFLPGIALNYPVFRFVQLIRLQNTRAGLVVVYICFGLAVTFFVLKSYFLTIPKEIEDASYIDGAGFLRTFFQIMLPIARPGIATAAILQFLNTWNEFFFALLLTSSDNVRTLPLALSYFQARFTSMIPPIFASIVLTIAPTIVVYVFLQKQVISSLTAGAVKG
jgi:raffinose/stachyose/melibiose transport system permease protein